ncbi:LLM class flavin-dependent oxidoreductase [Nocardiopsis coralliicola]
MRIGLFLVAAGFPGRSDSETLEAAVAAAVAAEEAGFDSVWFAEHHFMPYGRCPSAVALAAFALGRTRRIAVGTAVSVLATAHPVALAEQAALLDQVGQGRFRLGVGRGQPLIDLDVFGTGLGRWEAAEESLDLLLDAARGGPVRADAPPFASPEAPWEVRIAPDPRTRPHPPVLLAASSQSSLAMAAERGLPVLLGMHQTGPQQAESLAAYGRLAAAAGSASGTSAAPGHVVTAVAHLADTTGQARAELLAAMPRWLGPGLAGYRRIGGYPAPQRDPSAYAEFLCDAHMVGTPKECARRITGRFTETGAAELLLMVEGTGETESVLQTIERLGAEVLPEVRTAR